MPEVTSGWGRLTWDQSQWGGATLLNTGWGAKNFGENEWGDLSNVSFTLTGVSTTTATSSLSITVENFAGWGSDSWGFENFVLNEEGVFYPLTTYAVRGGLIPTRWCRGVWS